MQRRGGKKGEEEDAKGESEHDDVAMAADTTTVYLAALLNLISRIITGTWFFPCRKTARTECFASSTKLGNK